MSPHDTLRPWEQAGLVCPEGNRGHQKHPDPWWSGDSVFVDRPRPENAGITPPSDADWWHTTALDGSGKPWTPRVGDIPTSPAARRTLPARTGPVTDCGCLHYATYDVHAVYVRTGVPFPPTVDGFAVRVRPLGRLWPDPERGPMPLSGRGEWCCDRAEVLEVLDLAQWDQRWGHNKTNKEIP